jgi:uncharacterized protein (DUF1015 family)
VYVYHQEFTAEGTTYTRRGFMCRVRLERLGEGKIYPHEETHSAAKADRLKLFTAAKANLSQIFGLYPDESNDAQDLLEAAIVGKIPLEATDHLGVVHRMWPVTDVETIAKVASVMSPKSAFIADGHHRYETACNYRDQLAESIDGDLDPEHPANYVLMMCVSMSDPGMIVLPTHRLFRGLPELSSDELIAKLGECFECNVAAQGPDKAAEVWEDIETGDDQGTLGFYTTKDDRWVLASITDAGRAKMDEVAADKSSDWRSLGVSILHRLVIENLLETSDEVTPKYVRNIEEVVDGLTHGDQAGRDATGQEGQAGKFPLGVLVMPATVDDIRRISEHHERMPAKSTYFYPKLLCGLVINPLE